MKDQKKNLKDFNIDQSWTLFLDRDGVINEMEPDEYVCNWDGFVFLPEFLNNIGHLCQFFGRVIIVTNQRGVAREHMSADDLKDIHTKMLEKIEAHGGKIARVYHCPHHIDECECRKPKPGMALQAKEDFEDIDFSKSIMLGDSAADMEFGKNLGMITVYISEYARKNSTPVTDADFTFKDIGGFYRAIM